jgi:hypothetical protein
VQKAGAAPTLKIISDIKSLLPQTQASVPEPEAAAYQ